MRSKVCTAGDMTVAAARTRAMTLLADIMQGQSATTKRADRAAAAAQAHRHAL